MGRYVNPMGGLSLMALTPSVSKEVPADERLYELHVRDGLGVHARVPFRRSGLILSALSAGGDHPLQLGGLTRTADASYDALLVGC